MLKEISRQDALKSAAAGRKVYVFVPDDAKDSGIVPGECYYCHTVDEMLKGCTFFMDCAAVANPEFEQTVREMAEQGKNLGAPGAAPMTGDGQAEEGRHRKVDVGKLMALHDAGWSNVKIADEMNLHPITVGKYVRQYGGAEN